MFLDEKWQDIKNRNLISRITKEETFLNLIKEEKCKVYIGIDPTADKYHIGHLVPYMLVLRLLSLGVKVVILIGGFTGAVGDPSFKNKERPMMDTDMVANHTIALTNKLKKFFHQYEGSIEYVNNNDWLSKMSLTEFLNYSGHFSANRLLKMENIKQRLDNELTLSFKEVCYTLLQAIDFKHLFESKNVNMQIGGNDQWINILNGLDLIKTIYKEEVVGLTVNLLLTSDGKKMGKTELGTIWADGSMDSYEFWQYFRNVKDEDVKNLLYIFSLESVCFIDNLLDRQDINDCKVFLANTMTKLVYGQAVDMENILNNKEESMDISSKNLIDALLELKFIATESEGKRFLEGGAIQVNGEKATQDINLLATYGSDPIMIKLGKHKKKKINIIKS